MTYREAIESIQEDECADCYAPIEECRRCPVGLAIESLEKQEPKKPRNKTGYYRDNKCPSCGKPIKSGMGSSDRYRNNWCNKCGQAIDWSEEE